MASLQEVLQQLEPIEVPIVLGYVPPIDHTLIEFIDANRVPSRALLPEMWAACFVPLFPGIPFGRPKVRHVGFQG